VVHTYLLLQVHTPGRYTVTAMYAASGHRNFLPEFRLSVGEASEIESGSAASLESVLAPSLTGTIPGSPVSHEQLIRM
jgi:hypothetical protein